MVTYHTNALNEALGRLGGGALRAALVEVLRAQAQLISAELRDTVLAEVPAYTESQDPSTLSELGVHGLQHYQEIVRLLAGGAVQDFDFVRDHARLRAEHRFPLEALLHAYRCGHKVFARRMHEAVTTATAALRAAPPQAADVVVALAEFTIDYTDAISTIASTAYVECTRLLAEVAGDQRAQLLTILLDGYDESDARVAAILRRAGYLDTRLTYCVLLAQSVDATEMAGPARARRLADSIDQLVSANAARRLIDVRDAWVTCVFSAARRTSGWTPPHASLASRLGEAMATAGNGVLIGISNEVSSTSRIPTAHRQAMLAIRLTGLNRRVVPFAAIALSELMIHLSGEALQHLLPSWVVDFHAADDRLGGALSATLRAYADADMNLLKAAARLAVHPNTIYARLNRIRDLTGLNARAYRALSDLITVVEARTAASPPA